MATESTTRRLGVTTATLLVVASMVGTGVFTTTGFLVTDLGGGWLVLLAWGIGGLLALCGALSYGELAAVLPRNGGEYHLLGNLYHPAAGFAAGWLSLIVGFSAPLAAAALGFGAYLSAALPGAPPLLSGAGLIILLSVLHAVRVSLGSGAQNIFAGVKILLVIAFITGGLVYGDLANFQGGAAPAGVTAFSPTFAVALIFVSFSYSGWNGAIYLAGEIRDPARSLPKALIFGTGLVIVLYVGLNAVFLLAAPPAALAGRVDVGYVAAVRLFGEGIGRAFSAVIALVLVSSVSAMIMAGSRVYQTMGEDHRLLAPLARRSRGGAPWVAVALQAGVALVMVLTASFEGILAYIGFTLSLSAGLTVAGVFVLRRREGVEPGYRTFGYPLTPLLFIGLSIWMMTHTLMNKPAAAFWGLGTIASGLMVYAALRFTRDR